MTAKENELKLLSEQLWTHGIAAFCPTTLSEAPRALRATVGRLGRWISSTRGTQTTDPRRAIPLGIHLEGPFLNSAACGAHPPKIIRPVSFEELEDLWEVSRHTLKILTIAPETLNPDHLARLVRWSSDREIILSLGHSRATEKQAAFAFDSGFRGVTHAWNALAFHHRAPGPLGAALGRKNIYLELILDQIHVDPTLIRWTRKLHPQKKICFISDCAPAAATQKRWCSFGPLQVHFHEGASRLPDGQLAGGGTLVTDAYARWLVEEARSQNIPPQKLFQQTVQGLTTSPLRSLGLPLSLLRKHKIRWKLAPGGYYHAKPAFLL